VSIDIAIERIVSENLVLMDKLKPGGFVYEAMCQRRFEYYGEEFAELIFTYEQQTGKMLQFSHYLSMDEVDDKAVGYVKAVFEDKPKVRHMIPDQQFEGKPCAHFTKRVLERTMHCYNQLVESQAS